MQVESYGFCGCGCGERTRLAPFNRPDRGWVKGQPMRFIHGHGRRLEVGATGPDYVVDPETGCWLWQHYLGPQGYGRLARAESIATLAHRYVYEQAHRPLAPDEHLHHLCHVPACVNPEHLKPVGPTLHTQLHQDMSWAEASEFQRLAQTDMLPAELAERFGLPLTLAVNARWECRRIQAAVAA
jgi:hypothetical protein